ILNQKKVEIFLVKIRKSLAKQFLEIDYTIFCPIFSWGIYIVLFMSDKLKNSFSGKLDLVRSFSILAKRCLQSRYMLID
ncbi:MAG: hypothetical protein IKY43_04280, partial [Bacteroidales bacterium]|nr:hypothetical protein [Bacteroidales bacterium]